MTGLAAVGFLKLNLSGPGLTACVKQLWTKEAAPRKQ